MIRRYRPGLSISVPAQARNKSHPDPPAFENVSKHLGDEISKFCCTSEKASPGSLVEQQKHRIKRRLPEIKHGQRSSDNQDRLLMQVVLSIRAPSQGTSALEKSKHF